ncbi:related to large-conductance mechanosensitive channel [Phialocephala subalpina]|uniref:Related to large-conductance mechanosensitive channel n=1 Tax=Phialocephala subalpina TaxID=576137 RepID=A0A1L7WV02_9HELO|nr:related to large-conductance mechanosensitive channel [Phialocephala subalpina]
MPRIRLEDIRDDSQELIEHSVEIVGRGASWMWHGFTDWVLQDNIIEVAVGLILAAAFTTVVTSFVSDILLPPLSLLPFINRNMDEKFAVLRKGPNYNQTMSIGYNTMQQAADDGAVVLAYGSFLNKTINFIGVGLALYLLASIYEFFSKDTVIKYQVKCRYCRKRISEKAVRCVNCTSWLDGREDK